MATRLWLSLAAAAFLLTGFAPPQPPPPQPAAASLTTMDVARIFPCHDFQQHADGSWTLTHPVQVQGNNLQSITFTRGTPEAAVLGQRCD